MTLPDTARALDHDVLVVGAGTAGMEAGALAGRHGLPGPAGGEEPQRGRAHHPAEQGLPHPRLRLLHLHAEDGGRRPPPGHLAHGPQRGRGHHQERGRHLPRRPAPQGDLRRPRRLHRVRPVRRGLHRPHRGRVQLRAHRPPGSSHPLPPGRAQEGGDHPQRQRPLHGHLPRRGQAQRLHLAGAGRQATRRPSSSTSTTPPWSAASAGPATPPARATAPAATWRGRSTSGPSSGSWWTATTPSTPSPSTVRRRPCWTPASPSWARGRPG